MVTQQDKASANSVIGKLEGIVERHPKTMLVMLAVLLVVAVIGILI